MNRLTALLRRKLAALRSAPPRHRLLLLEALPLVCAARLALWVVPFRLVQRTARRMSRQRLRRASPSADVPAAAVTWAVRATGALVPGASCLTQALAGQVLLARHGHPSTLHIGVRRREDGALDAHAWLDGEGV